MATKYKINSVFNNFKLLEYRWKIPWDNLFYVECLNCNTKYIKRRTCINRYKCSICNNRNIIDKWDYIELELTWWEYVLLNKDIFNKILLLWYSWYKSNRGSVETNTSKTHIKIHRYIMWNILWNNIEWKVIDHINWNTLDNRVNNLRVCSNAQNNLNRTKIYNKSWFKWVSITANGYYQANIVFKQKKYTKNFKSKLDAAKWYDNKSVELHWEYGKTNKELWLY